MTLRDVVITGVGAVTPLGVGARALHERWTAGALRDPRRLGAVRGLHRHRPPDHQGGAPRRPLRRNSPSRPAARRSPKRAGRTSFPMTPSPIGCVIGTGIGGIDDAREQHDDACATRGPGAVSPLAVPLMMATPAAAAVHAPRSARAQSSARSPRVPLARMRSAPRCGMIQHGEAEAMRDRRCRGHADAAVAMPASGRWSALSESGVLAPVRRAPRRLRHGRGRGRAGARGRATRRARAEHGSSAGCAGYGSTSDALPHHRATPGGRAARRARCDSRSGTRAEPADVDYINAHGTSTQLNDRAETLALKRALGEHARGDPGVARPSRRSGTCSAPPARWRRSPRCSRCATGSRRRRSATRSPTRASTSTTCPEARPLATGDGPVVGDVERFGFGGHNVVLCIEAP